MANSWMFEDVEAFKRVDKNYNKRFIKDRKNFIESEVLLLELALRVSNLYEYKMKYEKEGYLKPILLLWLYWKNRETFERKFKKYFNFGDELHNETKNFVKIYLEYEDVFVRVNGANLYPSCFANRYIRVKDDDQYRFSKSETRVYMTDVQYL